MSNIKMGLTIEEAAECTGIYKCQSKNVQICSLKNVQFYN